MLYFDLDLFTSFNVLNHSSLSFLATVGIFDEFWMILPIISDLDPVDGTFNFLHILINSFLSNFNISFLLIGFDFFILDLERLRFAAMFEDFNGETRYTWTD